ncbi:TetR/AcrR family transcriptional regulator [Streptomyces sp. NPDC051976]|uniref:TetR/AcrR family transcriptional regulator n=1 Tax=Streptomyces sp. NPDC051976 TaxID=3154947 RepID=UPI003438ACBC
MAGQANRRQLVSNELLEHAGRLFAQQGFANTSLQDIADAMKISRPALYRYTDNKEALLAALVHDVLERVVGILEDAQARRDLDEVERIELALRQIVVHTAENATRFRLLDRAEFDLPGDLAAKHRQARHRVLELLTTLVEDAVAAGRCRPLPARSVALGWLGMANWVAWWYRPGVDGPPEAAAKVLVDVALGGVVRPDARPAVTGPWAALELVQDDLERLKQSLAESLPDHRRMT